MTALPGNSPGAGAAVPRRGAARSLFLLGFALCCLLTTGGALADLKDQKNSERSPIPQEVNVTVLRGQTVEITLSAVSASNKEVEFLLRGQPLAGKLLDAQPVRKGKTQASLRYQSDPASKAATDTFKYAARLPESAVSTSVDVIIRIQDKAPQIAVTPERWDAGIVKVGDRKSVEITLHNTGTGDFARDMPLLGEWMWSEAESAKLLVKPGETVKRKITFAPRSAKASEELLTFGDGAKAKLLLIGHGAPPIDAPSVLTLSWDAASRERKAVLTISNPTPQELTVTAAAPPGVECPKSITVNPNGSAKMDVRFTGPPEAALKGSLQLESLGAAQTVILTAAPIPAQLEISGDLKDGALDFGDVPVAQAAEAKKSLVLRNSGGTATSVFGAAPTAFLAEPFANGMEVKPGQTVALTFKIKPGAEGALNEPIAWEWDKNPLKWMLKARVLRAGEPMPAPLAPSSASKAAAPLVDPTPIDELAQDEADLQMLMSYMGGYIGNFKFNSRVPQPSELYQKDETNKSITIAWTPVVGDGFGYEVLKQEIRQVGGKVRPFWVRCPEAKIRREGQQMVAVIGDLPEYTRLRLKVVTTASDGTCSNPTKDYLFSVAEPRHFPWSWILLGAGLAFLVWYWWQRRALRRTLKMA